MLQWFRSKWWAVAVALVVIAGVLVVTLYKRELVPGTHIEPDLPLKAAAPPDLQKLRDVYAAGAAALARKDGADAVRHFSSFDFGDRAVEEYRLYHLATGYELAGNANAARVTLARLIRRDPAFVHRNEAVLKLGKLYDDVGDWDRASDVFPRANARWQTVTARLNAGDVAGAFYAARAILIHEPASEQAEDAAALVRAIAGVAKTAPLPLTNSERLDRAIALIASSSGQKALDELNALPPGPEVQLQRGLALHQLKRYEESNKILEPLTSGAYKQAIPALRTAARNYAIVAASIDPTVYKNVKEKKKTGTKKVRVGKGKKRRWVRKPVYKTVTKQIKLVDLAKKNKKDEFNRLASERLKDLLQLPLDETMRHEVLSTLIARATEKNQDAYAMELIPRLIAIDRNADPSLQHFWDKGWAAYLRGDLGTARKVFRFIADTYSHPNVKRQAEYWYARCAQRQGQKEEAAAIYQKLASAPYADIYALHAVSRGAKRQEVRSNPLQKSGPDWMEIAGREMPKELRLAYELSALSAMRDAYAEVRKNIRRTNARYGEALLADIYNAAGNKVLMYRSLRRAFPQLATPEQDSAPAYFLRMYYPMRYGDEIDEYAEKQNLDPELVRALILQESYYDPRARSPVGATGLMQLMPPTAQQHAGKMGLRYSASRLTDPEYNVRLGTYHLRMLIDLFRGNTLLAIAAYNAGQGNVGKWRASMRGKPMDEFLESIPFQETRNYVKRVTMLKSSYERMTI